eukprot:m.323674 g.323674  ORF g.323674 m.323674 type:complete len:378 (+) comp19726_c0_seq19:3348-4481(+)
MLSVLANNVGIARVLGMDGNGNITEQRFRTSCSNDQLLVAVAELVCKRGENANLNLFVVARDGNKRASLDLKLVDLNVGNGRLELARPVDKLVGAVDESFVVQANKGFLDSSGALRAHGKSLTLPVARSTQAFKLLVNAGTVLVFPLPHFADKLFAAKLVAGNALPGQPLFNNNLRGNAGVIATRVPQRAFATHAMPAGQGVFNGVCQRMSQMQGARDVGWWNDDGKLWLRGVHRLDVVFVLKLWSEETLLLPPRVPCIFNNLRIVRRGHGPRAVLFLPDWRWDIGRGLLRRCFLRCGLFFLALLWLCLLLLGLLLGLFGFKLFLLFEFFLLLFREFLLWVQHRKPTLNLCQVVAGRLPEHRQAGPRSLRVSHLGSN